MTHQEIDEEMRVHFSDPPIRRVELTLYFTPSAHIQANYVAPLKTIWGEGYPRVTERPPIWTNEDSDAPRGAPAIVSTETDWPIPLTSYTSVAGEREISFQGDRFEVSWSFLTEETPGGYPGFEQLKKTLTVEFENFTNVLSESGVALRVRGSECRYVNEVAGVSAPELAVGVLTGWQGSPHHSISGCGYVGVRLHVCPDEESHGCSSLVAVDSNDDNAPSMTIVVTRWNGEDPSGLGGLAEAHRELIETFVRHTSNAQHEVWGRTQ